MSERTITGYKGFNPDMVYPGFKFEIDKVYESEKGKEYDEGFRFYENPLDVFDDCTPASAQGLNRFFEVEGDGHLDKSEFGKESCTQIRIKEELGIYGLVHAAVLYIRSKVDWKGNEVPETEDYSAVASTDIQSVCSNRGNRSATTNRHFQSVAMNKGNFSVATNTGCNSEALSTGSHSVAANTCDHSVATSARVCSVASSTGEQSISTSSGTSSVSVNTGFRSVAMNTGPRSVAASTGDRSVAYTRGYKSAAVCVGEGSTATSTDDHSVAMNTGYNSVAEVTDKDSIAIVTGKDSKARGTIGSWLVLTEIGEWDEEFPIKEVKVFKVDGINIKANVYYKLIDGEAVECE